VLTDVNLPGGGVAKVPQLWTILQYPEESLQALMVCVDLPTDLSLALMTLVKIE
jgi:hypothetical protein